MFANQTPSRKCTTHAPQIQSQQPKRERASEKWKSLRDWCDFRWDRVDTHVFWGRTNWCCGTRDWWSRPRPREFWPPPSRRAAAPGRRRRPPRPPGTATTTRRPAATAAAAGGGRRRPALRRRRRQRRRRSSSSRGWPLQLPTTKREASEPPKVVACSLRFKCVFYVCVSVCFRCMGTHAASSLSLSKCTSGPPALFSHSVCVCVLHIYRGVLRCGNRRCGVVVRSHTKKTRWVTQDISGAVAVPIHQTYLYFLRSLGPVQFDPNQTWGFSQKTHSLRFDAFSRFFPRQIQ